MSIRKFFFDTEFVDTGTAIYPISVGVVDLDGREFYAEIRSAWRDHADSWIRANVATHLSGERLYAPAELREALPRFVGHEPAEFWAYFASYDWVVLCQLMGGLLTLPHNWSRFVRDLAWLDPSLKRIRALNIRNPKPHHALYDARELRDRYLALKVAA